MKVASNFTYRFTSAAVTVPLGLLLVGWALFLSNPNPTGMEVPFNWHLRVANLQVHVTGALAAVGLLIAAAIDVKDRYRCKQPRTTA